jgi:hypothetical protein
MDIAKAALRASQRLSPAASYFCYGKSSQNHLRRTLAGGDEAAPGTLRFSPERVRRPNSLRSDMGAFSPFPAAMLGEL